MGSGYAPVIASTLVLSISALEFKEHKAMRILAFFTIPIAGLALIVSQTRAWIGSLLIVLGLLFFLRKSKIMEDSDHSRICSESHKHYNFNKCVWPY